MKQSYLLILIQFIPMKYLIFILSFCFTSIYAQQIHIEYTYVKSLTATIKEDLYIKGNKVVSIQDSILRKVVFPSSSNLNINISTESNNRTIPSVQFVSEISDRIYRKFLFNSPTYSRYNKQVYLVEDDIPVMNWTIEETSQKKIAGYNCIKATANFRGSNVVAYFTKDLPYSTGPFKFYGLPGVILDVKVEGRADMRWRAEKVEVNNTASVDFAPKFSNLPKVSMKEFVKMNDEAINSFKNQIRAKLPVGVNVVSSTERLQIEKKFEWE